MLTGGLYLLRDLAFLAGFAALLRHVFGEPPRAGKWRLPTALAAGAAVSLTGYALLFGKTEDAPAVIDFLGTLVAFAAVPFLFRKARFWRSLAVLFLFSATVDTLWSFLAALFDQPLQVELIFETAVFALVLSAVLWSAKKSDFNVLAGAFSEIPAWMTVALILFELTCYYKEFGESSRWYAVLYAISACLIFLSILYLAFRVFRLVHTQNEILQRLNEQLLYGTARERSDEQLRRFRHDVKNHTIVLGAMLGAGDAAGAKRYMDTLQEDLQTGELRFSTGNPTVNALMNVKAASAKKEGITVTFSGLIPESGIEPKDMCVAVGNLLDNAVEACRKQGGGTVRFAAVRSANSLLLHITNPTDETLKLADGQLPATTKKDAPKNHGIGLRNVRDIAKKYNGTLRLSGEHGEFSAELLLTLPTDEGGPHEKEPTANLHVPAAEPAADGGRDDGGDGARKG